MLITDASAVKASQGAGRRLKRWSWPARSYRN